MNDGRIVIGKALCFFPFLHKIHCLVSYLHLEAQFLVSSCGFIGQCPSEFPRLVHNKSCFVHFSSYCILGDLSFYVYFFLSTTWICTFFLSTTSICCYVVMGSRRACSSWLIWCHIFLVFSARGKGSSGGRHMEHPQWSVQRTNLEFKNCSQLGTVVHTCKSQHFERPRRADCLS